MQRPSHRPRERRRAPLASGLALSLASVAMTFAASFTAPVAAAELAAYSAPRKPVATTLGRYDSRELIEIKFREGSDLRLVDGRLSSDKLGRVPVLDGLSGPAGPIASVEPLFQAAPAALASLTQAAQRQSGRRLADLSQWYRIRLRPDQDLARVVDRLNALSIVEIASPAPLPMPPPLSPNYNAFQQYRQASSGNGIDSDYAWGISGGDGYGISVLDIEYSWNSAHEDLSRLREPYARVANGTPYDPFNDTHHGTAVMGILVGDNNGVGVTGLVPGASARYLNVMSYELGYNPANAVYTAINALQPGDVMLLEQQASGPAACNGYVPLEWIPSVYDAVALATSRGIHVVQAAGNGAMNLDNAACFGSPFPLNRPDSHSIIVGAGGPVSTGLCSDGVPARSTQPFSTYGARVNLQGWGRCVTSAGYGNLYNGGSDATYTSSFSGTSSATPIVASAVVAISGIARQRGFPISPYQMRDLLIITGAPQTGGGHIGPLPNVRAALNYLGVYSPHGVAPAGP